MLKGIERANLKGIRIVQRVMSCSFWRVIALNACVKFWLFIVAH